MAWPALGFTRRGERITPIRLRQRIPIAGYLALFAATCGLRLIGLGRFSFDGDEIFSVQAAGASWLDMFLIVARDISHPPLFYVLLKLMLGLGPASESWVRILPAILGCASFFPLYGICRTIKLRNFETAVVLALFAFNGVLIYFSQHARMFSLLQFTSVWSIYAVTQFRQEDEPKARQIKWLMAINILLVYSHYWGWLVIAAEGCVLLIFDRAKLGRFVKATIWVAIAFSPWALAVLAAAVAKGSASGQISWITDPGGESIAWLWGDLNGAPNFPHATTIGILLFGMPIVVLLYRLASDRQFRSEFTVSPLVWALFVAVPVGLTLLAGYVSGQSVWGERQLIIIFVPYFILAGIAAARLPWRVVAVVAQAVLLVWAAVAGVQAWANPHQKLDWRSLANLIASESDPAHPTDVYALEGFVNYPLSFYLERAGASRIRVITRTEPGQIDGDAFWLVYRNTKWLFPETPEALFGARGFVIDRKASSSSGGQTIIALLFHRNP